MTLEALPDCILRSAIVVIYEYQLCPSLKRSESWVEAQRANIANTIGALQNNEFIASGGDLHFGHLAVACTPGYLDFHYPVGDWRRGRSSSDN